MLSNFDPLRNLLREYVHWLKPAIRHGVLPVASLLSATFHVHLWSLVEFFVIFFFILMKRRNHSAFHGFHPFYFYFITSHP